MHSVFFRELGATRSFSALLPAGSVGRFFGVPWTSPRPLEAPAKNKRRPLEGGQLLWGAGGIVRTEEASKWLRYFYILSSQEAGEDAGASLRNADEDPDLTVDGCHRRVVTVDSFRRDWPVGGACRGVDRLISRSGRVCFFRLLRPSDVVAADGPAR